MAEPSLSLPFPDVGSPQPESINLLRQMYPDEELIVGAAGKCRALDEQALEDSTRRLGDAGAMRLAAQQGRWATFLEADWIASDKALYYVTPGPESVFRWPWEAVSRVEPGRKKRLYVLGPRVLQVVRIQFAAGSVPDQIEVEIGQSSAQNLLAVWSHFRAK